MFSVVSSPVPIELIMPEFPNVRHGNLGNWVVSAGDHVTTSQALVEIETSVAVFDFDSPEDGVIAKIVVPSGSQKVAVGEVLFYYVQSTSTHHLKRKWPIVIFSTGPDPT